MTDWTNEENDFLIAQKRNGFSASEIAAKLGKSRSAVLGRLKRIRDRKQP